MKKYSLKSMMLDLEETDNHEDYENIIFRFLDKNNLFFTDIDKIRSQLSELIDSKFISTKSIENLEMYLNNIKTRNIILPSMFSLFSVLLSTIAITIQIMKIDISKKLKVFPNSILDPLLFIFLCVLLFFLYYKVLKHKRTFIFNLFKKIIVISLFFIVVSNMKTTIMCLPILINISVLLCLNEYSKYNKRYNEIVLIQKSIQQFKK